MLLKDFRGPILSFELIYFRNSFYYSFRYKILDHVGPLGKNLDCFVFLVIAEIYDFPSFQFILKLSYSKPFHNTLNYASTANIEEVMKFYNLSDKTFETDFNTILNILLPSSIIPPPSPPPPPPNINLEVVAHSQKNTSRTTLKGGKG